MFPNKRVLKAISTSGLPGILAMIGAMSGLAQMDVNAAEHRSGQFRSVAQTPVGGNTGAATNVPGWMQMAAWDDTFSSNGFSWGNPYRARPGRTPRRRSQSRTRRPAPISSSTSPLMSKKTIHAMSTAIARYGAIVRNGGWPTVSKGGSLRLNSRSNRVGRLRKRLLISGDMTQRAGISTVYDSYVSNAVKRFQKRYGLRQSGVADRRTLAALNVSARRRLAQLQMNYRRLVSETAKAPGRYVLVNIPASELEAVEGNRVGQRHRVVVGKPDRQTPVLNASIKELNFYPYWHVPASIVQKDLIPKLRKDPGYLRRTNLRVYREWGGKEVDARSINWRSPGVVNLKFRQDPGRNNALGVLRLNMPNKEAVYLHDTPLKSLFNRDMRAYSAGCVRVQNVLSLASWLARDSNGMSRSRIDQLVRSKESETIALSKSVPVYFSYFTAWATPDGTAHFRNDLYRRDGAGIRTELEHVPGKQDRTTANSVRKDA